MSYTVLTADDSTSIRKMIRFSIQSRGFVVIEAENGREALDLIKRNRVDMLITDLDMPLVGGLELTRAVRALKGYDLIPIVILTTESDRFIKDQAKASGATGWITKPFTPKQILSVIDKLIK